VPIRKPAPVTPDLHTDVLDFIRRGQQAQAAVDAIIAAEPERRDTKRPKRTA
jgi:hypothetical protein